MNGKAIRYPREPQPYQRRLVEALGFEVEIDPCAFASCPVCEGKPPPRGPGHGHSKVLGRGQRKSA